MGDIENIMELLNNTETGVDSLLSEITTLEEGLARVTEELRGSNTQKDGLIEQIGTIREQLESGNTANTDLANQLANLRTELTTERAKALELEESLTKMNGDFDAIKTRIGAINVKLLSRGEGVGDAETKSKKYLKYKSKYINLKKKIGIN